MNKDRYLLLTHALIIMHVVSPTLNIIQYISDCIFSDVINGGSIIQ